MDNHDKCDRSSESTSSNEPYETFSIKVERVARSLDDISRVELKRARGGSFNRVIIAKLQLGEGMLEGIFRLPRKPRIVKRRKDNGGDDDHLRKDDPFEHSIQDQAAVLRFLADAKMPTPALLAFDATASNAMEYPFVFQRFSRGICLHDLYGSMCTREKLSVVDALVSFLLMEEDIRFPTIGGLRAKRQLAAPVKGSYLVDLAKPELEIEVTAFQADSPPVSPSSSRTTSTYMLLSDQLEGWYRHAVQQDSNPDIWVDVWQDMLDILREMRELDFFPSLETKRGQIVASILYHWDLEPRNILVRKRSNALDETGREVAQWEIDKVVDWDDILAVPPVLARLPPWWLWGFDDDGCFSRIPSRFIPSNFEGCIDRLPLSYWDPNDGGLSPSNQQIKQHFENKFVLGLSERYQGYDATTYYEEAYGSGRWIRRLADFVIHGHRGAGSCIIKFIEEWSAAFHHDVNS